MSELYSRDKRRPEEYVNRLIKLFGTEMSNGVGEIFIVGDVVDYHSIIGGKITSSGHIIEFFVITPSNMPCAWITGKAGGVHIDALSHAIEGGESE